MTWSWFGRSAEPTRRPQGFSPPSNRSSRQASIFPTPVGRLERGLSFGTSLFERYPFVVVSIDFIKGDRYKDEFIRTCPELVIVDEAHGCTLGAERGRQRRHELVSRLAADDRRHL